MALPTLSDPHTVSVLVLTVLALFLFTRDRIPFESSSLMVLVVLTVGFELFPYRHDGELVHAVDFFHGFGHEALVAVCGLLITGQGLVRTGALEPVGRGLSRMWGSSPQLSLLVILVVGGVFSAFFNNTPIVVLLLPILISVSLRAGAHPSRVLMPMGFATLVGGMGTTIGTSTNLLVVSVAASLGMQRFEMFDFVLPAAIAGGVGILYLWLIAPRLLPPREALLEVVSPRVFAAQLKIPEESFADGKTLSETMEKTNGLMKVSRIQRGSNTYLVPLPDAVVKAGDRLILHDTPQNLKEFEQALGATLYSGESPVDDDHPLTAVDQQIAEIVVTQGSDIERASLRYARFIDRFQLVALALHRPGRAVWSPGQDIADVVLRNGDVLLVQGAREQIASLKKDTQLLVLDATLDLPHTKKAPVALAIMAVVILSVALGVLPIAVSAVCGALAMVLSGCLTWREASNALSAPVILIVAASLALGQALLITGGTDYLTRLFLALTTGASPVVVMSGLMLLLAVLTNVVSNNAAAVIGTPIAIGIARQLELPEEPFVLAVLFGANMSYATPMAYKTNLLVMTAGGYKFSDFVRVGVPLTLLMWLTLSWVLPLLYGI
jgi:di/tricarboxylate transporter